MDVRNATGEHLGEIEDIVLGLPEARVAYAVVSFGELLGVGGKYFAVPWSALEFDPDRLAPVLDVRREGLLDAPGFDPDHWPDMADPDWVRDINRFYGRGTNRQRSSVTPNRYGAGYRPSGHRGYRYGPYWFDPYVYEPSWNDVYNYDPHDPYDAYRYDPYQYGPYRYAPMRYSPHGPGPYAYRPYRRRSEPVPGYEDGILWVRRLTALVGLRVMDSQGYDLGELEDILVSSRNGRLAYGLLSFGGFLGVGEDTAVVPWSAVDLHLRREAFVLDAGIPDLQAARFETDRLEELAGGPYGRLVHGLFRRVPYWIDETSSEQAREESGSAPWETGSAYVRMYDPEKVVAFDGVIRSVGRFRPQPGAIPGIRLRVDRDDGEVATVYAGPKPFASAKGMKFHFGDRVTIMGSRVDLGGRKVVVARRIDGQKGSITLRDDSGRPLWETAELQGVEDD